MVLSGIVIIDDPSAAAVVSAPGSVGVPLVAGSNAHDPPPEPVPAPLAAAEPASGDCVVVCAAGGRKM